MKQSETRKRDFKWNSHLTVIILNVLFTDLNVCLFEMLILKGVLQVAILLYGYLGVSLNGFNGAYFQIH